jgi:D-threo-aldose 1-dehydrogenase
MSEIRVGRTDLLVPRIGLGTAALGNFQQAISDADAVAVVDRSLEHGVRYVDTAPLYGHGLAESRVGQAVAKVSRDGLVISTKVGRLLREGAARDETQYHNSVPFYRDVPSAGPVWDFSYDGVRRSVEESLERTGLDHFEILLLHDPDQHLAEAASTGYAALRDLRAAGLVRAIGAGMNDSAPLAKLVRSCELDLVLLAGRYTLLDQSALSDLLPACEAKGVSVVIGGVFNSGVLVDPVPGASFDYVPAGDAVLGKAVAIREVCRRHDVPLAAAALRFPLAHPRVCTVLMGPRTVDELEMNLELFCTDVPADLWADLRRAGLIGPDVPTPE